MGLSYYKYNNNIFISQRPLEENFLQEIPAPSEGTSFQNIFIVKDTKPHMRVCYTLDSTNIFKEESLSLINSNIGGELALTLPDWITESLESDNVFALNTTNPNWRVWFQYTLSKSPERKWNLTLSGLGDVGGTLLLGLKLLGSDCIDTIKIFDLSKDRIQRWVYECGQIASPSLKENSLKIVPCSEAEMFNCDMFIFCVSVGVPKIGDEKEDVRMVQYRGNSKVIAHYAKLARDARFKGVFAVVSDPVDHLCKAAYHFSNIDGDGNFDGLGLSPDQISGFGLGVMNARAAFYAEREDELSSYLSHGRAYGPHGEGLFIANSISEYNHENSLRLTHLAKTANLAVRETGFKPFIAPALSSGTLSLLSYIRGDWHYSTNYINGAFFGCRNKINKGILKLESLPLHDTLYSSLKETYFSLKDFEVK